MRLPIDSTTVALWHFDEAEDHQLPADETGNVDALLPPATLTRPTSVAGTVGGARQWAADQGFHAVELVANATMLTRDVCIEVIAWLPWATTNGTYRLVTRGNSAVGAPETELYGLQLVVSGAPGAPIVSLQMRWEEIGEVAAVVTGVTFIPPADGDGWLYLAATRRWISTAEAVVAYYCNGALLGTVTSTSANIGDGIGGTMLIGCETVAPATGLPVGSIIDEVRISSAVHSAEEIRWTYRYAFVFGVYGYELLKALLPQGKAWTSDPDSRVQQFFATAGDALGLAWSKAAELLEDFLPDRAWSFLDRWEAVTRLAPGTSDSIATRRARVVGFLRKVHGYTRDQIVEAIYELLDCLITDLVFVESSNIMLETFDNVTLGPRWTNTTIDGSAAEGGGILGLEIALGDNVPWNEVTRTPAAVHTVVPAAEGVDIVATISSLVLGENGAATGVFVWDQVSGDAHIFGIKRSAGANKWWHATIIGGVYAETIGATIGAGTTYMIRYVDRGAGLVDLDYQIDGTNYNGPWTTIFDGVATMPTNRYWCGVFLSSTVDPVVTGSAVDFDSFRIYAPRARHVFEWFIYRNPALGGTPDLRGARLVIEKMSPAHEDGAICTSLELLYDTAENYYEETPLGA